MTTYNNTKSYCTPLDIGGIINLITNKILVNKNPYNGGAELSDLQQNEEFPHDTMTFDTNHCFLCGALLTDETRTEEHVYPHWLQTKYNLWNQKLILLNRTSIPYKNLTIPCCRDCNERMGNTFEKPIKTAVSIGYDAFVNLDKQTVFQWLCKLFYGILYKEMFLMKDRSNPSSGTILDDEDLREERTLLLFLQAVLTKAKFEGHKPYSIIVFRLHSYEADPYWGSDNTLVRTFFMRMGDIGIIANLMDNGVNEEIFMGDSKMHYLTKQTLHPIQFAEICAKFLYKSHLLSVNPSYVFMLDEHAKPEMVLGTSTSLHEDTNWNQEFYAKILENHLKPWGIDYDMLYQKGGLVRTFLWDENGDFIEQLRIE